MTYTRKVVKSHPASSWRKSPARFTPKIYPAAQPDNSGISMQSFLDMKSVTLVFLSWTVEADGS